MYNILNYLKIIQETQQRPVLQFFNSMYFCKSNICNFVLKRIGIGFERNWLKNIGIQKVLDFLIINWPWPDLTQSKRKVFWLFSYYFYFFLVTIYTFIHFWASTGLLGWYHLHASSNTKSGMAKSCMAKVADKWGRQCLLGTSLNCAPADTPALSCTISYGSRLISSKEDLDDIAPTPNVGRQGCVDLLVSNHKDAPVIMIRATGSLHYGCSIPVRNCQVVVRTAVAMIRNVIRRLTISGHVKFSEF